ncbi:CGNR zinc finger domain-containing protein [Nonomuraea sp. NPDC049714]|uniref:CGNR zinc finger domain-containing protein n=1 Tax=Nonomuraea sp. NPDC049714 TaxID=3364357 RepID=UPI0037BBF430
MTIEAWRITGQSQIDSYVGRWVEVAVTLINTLTVDRAHGRLVQPPADRSARLSAIGDNAGELSPRGPLTAADADGLAEVAAELRPVFGPAPELDALNAALTRHDAVPHVQGDPPVLTFHREDAGLVDAWAASAATALAMVIGVGQGVRLRSCEADGCDLVFFDVTRNASRRFCGLSCQNRAKASAYRARRRA